MTRLFVASNLTTGYPYKLQKPSTVCESVVETTDEFILDSGIGSEVSNDRVLELADEYDPDYVVPKDYLHDQERTTESVREFLEMVDLGNESFQILIPLQPPHDEHYDTLSDFSHYVLGGMAVKSISTSQQISWIRNFREKAPDCYAHGLGVGGSYEFARAMTEDNLLDSIDCSTPELAASHGCVFTQELGQREVRIMKGEGARKRNIPLAEFNSWQVQDAWNRLEEENHETQPAGEW